MLFPVVSMLCLLVYILSPMVSMLCVVVSVAFLSRVHLYRKVHILLPFLLCHQCLHMQTSKKAAPNIIECSKKRTATATRTLYIIYIYMLRNYNYN